ncbi:MAG TPA: anti-sigma factor [Thermoanaerobaculia bacterium]
MSQIASHPARDAEFLSRLHDGELNAAERAQFESHRAHCAECRNAAFDFEAALSLYRSSRPRPAPPDLSSRILRKLQQSHRRRPAFGSSFGIDLRWAGAFAAAVIAAIIGFSIVARQEAVRKMAARTEAIPVTMEGDIRKKEEAQKPAADALPNPAPRVDHARRQSTLDKGLAKDTEESGAPKTLGAQRVPAAPASAAPAPPAAERKEAAARDRLKLGLAPEPQAGNRPEAAAPVLQSQPLQQTGGVVYDRAGGDGANFTDADFGASLAVRVTITAADGGSQPELVADQKIDLPPTERGHEYSLSVDPQGRVSDVRRVETLTFRQKAAKPKSRADEKQEAAHTVKPPQVLWDLRFHPADRPRLIRVKVE